MKHKSLAPFYTRSRQLSFWSNHFWNGCCPRLFGMAVVISLSQSLKIAIDALIQRCITKIERTPPAICVGGASNLSMSGQFLCDLLCCSFLTRTSHAFPVAVHRTWDRQGLAALDEQGSSGTEVVGSVKCQSRQSTNAAQTWMAMGSHVSWLRFLPN